MSAHAKKNQEQEKCFDVFLEKLMWATKKTTTLHQFLEKLMMSSCCEKS